VKGGKQTGKLHGIAYWQHWHRALLGTSFLACGFSAHSKLNIPLKFTNTKDSGENQLPIGNRRATEQESAVNCCCAIFESPIRMWGLHICNSTRNNLRAARFSSTDSVRGNL